MTVFNLSEWTPEDFADPYPLYRRFRDQKPVHRGADGLRYVFGYREVREVLLNPAFGHGADRPAPPQFPALSRTINNWPVFLDPPCHPARRRLLSPALLPKAIAGQRQRIAVIAEELVGQLTARPLIDVVADFALPFPVKVLAALFGASPERETWIGERMIWLLNAAAVRVDYAPPPDLALAERGSAELVDYLRELIKLRRGHPGPDLISQFANARGPEGPLSEYDIADACVNLVVGSHGVTGAISKAIMALHRFPWLRHRLRVEPALLPEALDELIRYDTPVQAISRAAHRDTTVGDEQVRRGEVVMLMLGAANRDPDQFEAPDEPRLGRRPGSQLGFSLGAHYCLGAHLARAEAEIGLHALLTAFPHFQLIEEPVRFHNYLASHGPVLLRLHTRGEGEA